MAGVIGLRGPDIAKRDALRGYKVEWRDADRPIIRPHTGAPVLHLVDGQPVVDRHVFGFSRRFSSFNARDDKLAEGKMWKGLFGKDRHHGVVPVSYILEWSEAGGIKRPYRIERADGAAMAVPALIGDYWEEKGTQAFALVTVAPNAFVASFHDRMIGQLRDDQLDVWLHPGKSGDNALRECLRAPANEDLIAYPLDADVGSAKFSDAGALEAVGPPLRWADGRVEGLEVPANTREPVARGEARPARADAKAPRQARLGDL